MKSFKRTLFLFFIFQLAFSMFIEDIFEMENVFPFYNWKIFHTRPDKYWTRNFLILHRLDDELLDPPRDVLDVQERFPKIAFYTFTEKIRKLEEHFNDSERVELIKYINENLNRHYRRVEWEFVEMKFDVIDFYLSRSVLERKSLGFFVAERSTSP